MHSCVPKSHSTKICSSIRLADLITILCWVERLFFFKTHHLFWGNFVLFYWIGARRETSTASSSSNFSTPSSKVSLMIHSHWNNWVLFLVWNLYFLFRGSKKSKKWRMNSLEWEICCCFVSSWSPYHFLSLVLLAACRSCLMFVLWYYFTYI